jgi:3,4-dihydroxy 2-butanone 4-phosphate synthase/GTP cyclohydrolase II
LQYGLKIGTIADLISFRSHNESLVQRVGERTMATPQGEFSCTTYRDRSGGLHLALKHGQWAPGDEVLVRVHEPFTALDLLNAADSRHSWPLPQALAALKAAPAGVAVLLNCTQEPDALLEQLVPRAPSPQAPRMQMDLRTYGVGAQILREQGVARMKLLGSPRRMPSMTGYGLEVTGFQPVAR